MGLELDLVLYALSMVFLGIFSGACTVLEVLSLNTGDRPEDNTEDAGYVDLLLENPVLNGIGLGITRALAAGATVVLSVRVAAIHFFPQSDHWLVLVALLTAASLIVPVMIARFFAVQSPERFAFATRVFTYPAIKLSKPAALVVVAVVRRLFPGVLKLLVFQIIPLKQKIEVLGTQNGEEQDDEQKLMSSVLDFGETRVREVMVPRIDVVALNLEMEKNEALEVILEAGHSRVPVFEETIDRIQGVIYTKDLLGRVVAGEEFSLGDLTREAFFVPESKKIDDLLTEFRARRQHLAIVVDEYGGTAGIVTMEDVLEEIVGDIQDEFDSEEALVERIDGDSAVCNAKIHLDELSEELGIRFPEDAPDSLGGLLYQMIGSVPRIGDSWRDGGLEFEIQSVVRQRIEKVLIRGLSSVTVDTDDDIE
jgi:CBS domain containing-hemolysin-like protein